MATTDRRQLLGPLLKGVSRSFYLTLSILPAGMRDPVGLAYLLARAADTIADTALIAPGKRLELLLSLRRQVNGEPDAASLREIVDEIATQQKDSDERTLLESLGPALEMIAQFSDADIVAIRGIVSTLTEGMEFDLRTFPEEFSGRVVALEAYSQLDRYTYMVAGCVGEFWTRMTYAHVTARLGEDEATMIERGIRLGKALQLTNILRDCPKDLRISRCYLPQTMLAEAGLSPEDLLRPENSHRARPVLLQLTRIALDHFRAGLEYTTALPRTAVRLRLACVWPIVIGLETFRLLVASECWLDPQHPAKIRRNDVYRIIAGSLPRIPSNRMLRSWIEGLIRDTEEQIRSGR
ncbi:phytoene/squalene synthase family protein [Silvibacterium dinghuense]|uniref:Squalene/phytoene synthase family protein n=1 Tax=Silvibacterium dinghuense TaxID=1560006 RepID=A0A4Q1SAZ5_9BACT|nr:phytoene/squalene synthase family protein [Silvibacterium dinghuense]RXS93852.1 squalene/phytoene synthase family protein [Silvibacterium dinghuense]GGH08231.1 farnesyl-diphosphate farnesyltransferase [Silvibacterium dinghuense]